MKPLYLTLLSLLALVSISAGATASADGCDYKWYKPSMSFWAKCGCYSGGALLGEAPVNECYGRGEYLSWLKMNFSFQRNCYIVVNFPDLENNPYPAQLLSPEVCLKGQWPLPSAR